MINGRNSKISLASFRETISAEQQSRLLRMAKKAVEIQRKRKEARRAARKNERANYILLYG